MTPKLLTIQTATTATSLAITDGEKLLAELVVAVRRAPSDWLLDAVQNLLTMADSSVDELDGFAVVVGPGAFTGLRVGLATVKGLAMATSKPIVAVSSLQTLALQVPHSTMPVCAVLDARKQEVYSCLYTMEKGLPTAQMDEAVLSPEALLEKCVEPTLFVGDGATTYRTLIVRQMGDRAHFLPPVFDPPRASLAALLALRSWQAGMLLSPEELQPTYIRQSEAEINWVKPGSST